VNETVLKLVHRIADVVGQRLPIGLHSWYCYESKTCRALSLI